ncbi:MAG TPA: HEAT repeat domain-containing protein [Vicinamibacteria bacterium]|nr:HEAT repeat domain-containing protein [Vicinamibacteria bacterium]
MRLPLRAVPVCLSLSLAGATPAQAGRPPGLVHARLDTRSAAAGLEEVARRWAAAQAEPAWLAYEVPAAGEHEMCCFDSVGSAAGPRAGSGCRIERHGSFTMRDGEERAPLLDDENAIVLLRAEQGRVARVRVVSRGCGLDAGGRSFTWIEDVEPVSSLRLLSSFVGAGTEEGKKDKLSDGAIMAVAVHAGTAADETLERFLDPSRPVGVRKQAAFWMGNLRGRRGYEALSRLVRDDPSEKVREHGVFALGQSAVPEAVGAMIRVARQDPSAHVRGQALFWLGQKAGGQARAAIARALEDDPETDVKKKAVFALSQLPKDEGVPLLIEVAKTNRNPEVRKQAMFWLGQSRDARALAFFEDVLAR